VLESLSESVFAPVYPASANLIAGCSSVQSLFECELPSFLSAVSGYLGGADGPPALPGHGVAGPGCGGRVQHRSCLSCGRQFWVKRSCMMRECPECSEKWAFREARFAAWRIWTGSKRRCRELGWAWSACRVLHVVVSIPDRGQGLDAARSSAYDVARRHRLDGGMGVFHPFRVDDDGVYRLDGTVHFHMVVLAHGDVPQGGTDGDVVFKVLRDAEHGDFRGFRGPVGIRRCLVYLLSHAGVLEGRHAVTWWGSMSHRLLPVKVLQQLYPDAWDELNAIPDVRCPSCGSTRTVEILEDGSIDPGGAARACGVSHWRRGTPAWAGDAAKNRAALLVKV